MQGITDFLSDHILAVVAICGWYLMRRLHQAAPSVTNAAKDAAGKKAASLLLRLFK
jgi:hypothetical protein